MTIRSRTKHSSEEEADRAFYIILRLFHKFSDYSSVVTPISAEPGFIVECDSCFTNLTHAVRIRCADPVCESSSIDICADCFRQGKEFGRHKANHPYRIIEKHHIPIFDEDWEADE